MKNDIPQFDLNIQRLWDAFRDVAHVRTFYQIARVETNSPIGNGELANMMEVSRSTITNRINVLLKQGLILSTPDPSHRSRHFLTLTVEGKRLRNKLIASVKNATTAEAILKVMVNSGITISDLQVEEALLKQSKKGDDPDES